MWMDMNEHTRTSFEEFRTACFDFLCCHPLWVALIEESTSWFAIALENERCRLTVSWDPRDKFCYRLVEAGTVNNSVNLMDHATAYDAAHGTQWRFELARGRQDPAAGFSAIAAMCRPLITGDE